MSFKDALARAKRDRPEPVLQSVAIGDELFQIPITRLDGMDWAAVAAEAPPESEMDARLGFNTSKAALVACRRHSRLLDAEGEPVPLDLDESGKSIPTDWVGVFDAISGVEVQAIAATWWAMNAHDPNQRVVALKKASLGGGKTS